MGILDGFFGQAQIQLTSADLPKTLAALTHASIALTQVNYQDELTVIFYIKLHQTGKVIRICKKRGDRVTVLAQTGLARKLFSLRSRPILVISVILLFFLTLFIPRHVFFFSVEGNQKIPNRLILATAERCGIYFGASRNEVRSEKVKNAMLEALPTLQWVGVNTKGCVAVISVQERQITNPPQPKYAVSKIVSACDAVITSCTATTGWQICSVGQAVQKGDTLISGYSDMDNFVMACRSSGEVRGNTSHTIHALFPVQQTVRKEKIEEKRKYSFIIGKKRINLWDTRGLSYSRCGKITDIYRICLFGRFFLPVCFEVERYQKYIEEEQIVSLSQETMERFASEYLTDHMVAGEILRKDIQVEYKKRVILFDAVFYCNEMIGREQNEELRESEQNS